MPKNKRHFSRVDFQSAIIVRIQGRDYQAELIDISLKGALISLDSDSVFEEKEKCAFEFSLDESSIVVKSDAQIVYSHEKQLGLKFLNMDLESMIHLRRLIELNLGDPDKIQQELFFLVDPSQEN